MVKIRGSKKSIAKRAEPAREIDKEQWEYAFAYLRTHRHDHHKWRDARSLLSGISLNTLKSRFKANNAEKSRRGPECVLGDDVEAAIIEYLYAQADVGNAVPVDLLPPKVRDIAKDLFSTQDLSGFVGGKDWHTRFLERHPGLAVRLGQLTEVTRQPRSLSMLTLVLAPLGPPMASRRSVSSPFPKKCLSMVFLPRRPYTQTA